MGGKIEGEWKRFEKKEACLYSVCIHYCQLDWEKVK